jgi:hypothetical protein
MDAKSTPPYYSSETEFKNADALQRKKYNVIAESTRKDIISLLTE